jgi:dihydroflavonol-4-reductase
MEGTLNVAQACRIAGVKRMLHVSSAGNEEFEFNLQDSGLPYHISKRLAEERVMAEVGRDLDAVVVNPASITGPMRIARLLKNVRRSPVTPCFSGGNCVVHIDDVVDGIMAALGKGRSGQRYILGGENLTFRAMSEKAARMLGLARWFVRIPPVATGLAAAVMEPWARWRHRPPRFAHMIHYCANRFMFYDSGKARRELGYQPRDFDAILRQSMGDSLAH